jgi:hypothetical protein
VRLAPTAKEAQVLARKKDGITEDWEVKFLQQIFSNSEFVSFSRSDDSIRMFD